MISSDMIEICNNFIELKEKGYTIPEIAKMYGISKSKIYSNLGEIAKTLGCAREDLLIKVHSNHSKWSKKKVRCNFDFNDLIPNIDNMLGEVKCIVELIENAIG